MKDKKVFWQSLIATVIAFVLYTVGKVIITNSVETPIVQMFLREVLLTILAVIAAKATGRLSTLKLTKEGLGTGLLVGILMIGQDSLNLISDIKNVTVTVSAGLVVLFIISMVLVGICEELLFRGVLLNGMLDAFGCDSISNVWKGVIASSVAFGCLHIFNLLTGASVVGCLTQAISCIPSGMFFAAIYLRSNKNIWPCALIHGYGDACSFISDGFLAGATFSSVVGGYSPILLVSSAIQVLVVIFVLRKKKLQPLVDKGFKK